MARARTLTLRTKVEVTGADKLNNLGKTLQRTGSNLTVGVTLPLIGLGGAMVALAEEAARADAELSRTFESMGAGAWTTVDALKAQQKELQGLTTFGDEEISHLQSVLLTFGNVTGESFDRATEAALDMSTLLGQDLQSSAIQLGKALQDPIRGVTALRRVGVSFNEQQLEQIRLMTEAGDVAAAQAIILSEVERQFGGAAEAMAGTAGGSLKQALNALGDAGEEFGAVIAPLLRDVANGLKGVATWLNELNPATKEWVVRIGALAAALGPVLIVVGSLVRAFASIKGAGAALISVAPKIAAAFHLMLGPIGFVTAAISALALAWVTDFGGIQRETEKTNSILALHFGDLGDRANALADRFGTNFDDIKRQVRDAMDETGLSVEQVLERMEAGLEANGEALKSSSSAAQEWADDQKAAYAAMNGHVTAAMDSATAAVGLGVDGMAEEMGEAPGKMADELLAAQQELMDATNQLVNFMEQALSPAQEKFRLQGFLSSQELAAGLASGNPLVAQKATELRDAAVARLRELDGYSAGVRFSTSFAYGMVDRGALSTVLNSAYKVALAARGVFPSSEPKDPNSPFRGITTGWGFMETLAKGLASTSGVVAQTLSGTLSTPVLASGVMGSNSGALGVGTGDVHIHLTVNGDLTADREAGIVNSILRGWNVVTTGGPG